MNTNYIEKILNLSKRTSINHDINMRRIDSILRCYERIGRIRDNLNPILKLIYSDKLIKRRAELLELSYSITDSDMRDLYIVKVNLREANKLLSPSNYKIK